jgi:transposase
MDGIKTRDGDETTAEHGKRTRRHWTTEIKRQIVREAAQPGAVRQQVALRHGVNVSVVNRWRRELGVVAARPHAKKTVRKVQLLPVRVSRSPPPRITNRPVPGMMAANRDESIEVAFSSGQRVTIRGVVDGGVLRIVLQELSQC